MARYNRLDNQAPVQSELSASRLNVGRSAFDFSHVHSGTAIVGALTPVLNMEVVPNEDIDISLNALIQLRNPLVRPLLNGMRVYFHGYVDYLVNIWEGAKNFIDAGRSGKVFLSRPKLIWKATSGQFSVNAATPLSLLDYLGLPAEVFVKKVGDKSLPPIRSFEAAPYLSSAIGSDVIELAQSPDFFPADCCFMYQRVWRDFYSNKNLLMNNKYWFPENEEDFIISYDAVECVQIQKGYENSGGNAANQFYALTGGATASDFDVDVTPEPNNPKTSAAAVSGWQAPSLCGLKFRQFKGDRFTAGSPFPDLVRGDIPVLSPVSGDFNPVAFHFASPTDPGFDVAVKSSSSGALSLGSVPPFSGDIYDYTLSPLPATSNITLNDIRALETFTVFKERMARTNGDYNDMVEAQYGYNPNHETREAQYIGGFYTDFNFSTVVQTSESTDENPLGSKSGDATASGTGSIGHIHTRDFGWIQVYMSIVPDVMYSQGIERQFSKKIQSEMYFPLFNNLAPQAVLNKELFVSGDVSKDNDVFSYEDRYAEYKSRNNRVSGFMALSHEVAEFDASRIMFRRFKSTPSFNSQFTTLVPENVDMQVFTVYDEPPFDFQIGFNIRRVFPGPYTSIPGSMSSNLHA